MFHYLSHLPIKRIDVDDHVILAAAKFCDAKLVHKDPEFEKLRETIPQIIPPYKTCKKTCKK